MIPLSPRRFAAYALSFALFAAPGFAKEGAPELLDILLENGSINQEQYDALSGADTSAGTPDAADTSDGTTDAADASDESSESLPPVSAGHEKEDGEEDADLTARINEAVEAAIDERFGVKASYTSKGFRLETKDGNFQTNLQWRAQFRLSWPERGDPRNVGRFGGTEELNFQARRLRMKIGGHGYRPWLKYYFEVDLEPTRTTSSGRSDTRVIDWRIDIAKYKKIALRVGQWKIDFNRERVDSSGRQQFVERSIANRIFTIDRQVGVSLRGRLFEGTPGDLNYYFGVFTGEGRGVANDDNGVMYAARLQWNFLGRVLKLRQTDVERTEKPTGSLSFGFAEHRGRCTRWSSSGCGNLQAYVSPGTAFDGQYKVTQATQGFAFKYQGLSIQQEFHWKRVKDRSQGVSTAGRKTNYWGGYAQAGYFFNELFEVVPEELELAFRYAMVREPEQNPGGANLLKSQMRQEFTGAANWFFNGHNNKVTLDYSYLTLDNDNATTVVFGNTEDHRVRLQWDISF